MRIEFISAIEFIPARRMRQYIASLVVQALRNLHFSLTIAELIKSVLVRTYFALF